MFITAAQQYSNESYKRDVVTRYFPYIFCEKIQVLFQLGLVWILLHSMVDPRIVENIE